MRAAAFHCGLLWALSIPEALDFKGLISGSVGFCCDLEGSVKICREFHGFGFLSGKASGQNTNHENVLPLWLAVSGQLFRATRLWR